MTDKLTLESLPNQVATLTNEVKELQSLINDLVTSQNDHAEIIGIEDVSRITGYKLGTIYQYVHKRKIPFHKPKHGGNKLFFFKTEIEEWLKGSKSETTEEYCTRLENELYDRYEKGGVN